MDFNNGINGKNCYG